jgi:hypothetical protein
MKPTHLYFTIFISPMFLFSLAGAQDSWPLHLSLPQGRAVIYQPQPELLEGDIISARAALSFTPASAEEPVFGAIWLRARMLVDRANRMATFDQVSISELKFPATEDAKVDREALAQGLSDALARTNVRVPLDLILASWEEEQEIRTLAEGYSNDPPEIIFRRQPAVLILIDGEPKMTEVDNGRYSRVANTPFLILFNPADKRYYLYGEQLWYSSADWREGWSYLANPPRRIANLGREFSRDQRQTEGVRSTDDLLSAGFNAPEILVRTQPAELIVTDGAPEFAPIQRTNLLYMSNTESHVFLAIPTQTYYVLLSGRWFSSSNFNSPWSFVASDVLPADFAAIPEGSAKDIVLAHVAGTDAAREALLDAQIPQTATIDRRSASTSVSYDGQPQFEAILEANLEYAVNTASTVLRAGNRYYCVDNGVWFESASPNGPWTVAVERPRQVERIPPSYPVYHVKYVYIYDYTPDVVYVGYTPGYLGSYIFGPTIVYGTGFWYRPWYDVYYFPRPWTWGFHMYYNPWTGWSMGFGFHIGNPYAWFPMHYHRRPGFWGPYSWNYWGGWWGPIAYRPPVHVPHNYYYGPRPSPSRDVRPGSHFTNTVYDVQPRPGVQPHRAPRPITADRPASGARPRPEQPSTRPQTRPEQTPARPRTPAEQARPPRSDTREPPVYTDPRGEIYRRGERGEWQHRERGQWQRMTPPSDRRATPENYDRSRYRGQIRTENYRDFQRKVSPPAPNRQSRQPRGSG